MKKKYTIRDIAKAANVSHMTVSRVLNNVPKVRAATRARVNKVIAELDFEPNARARAFATQKSHLIGLVVSDISNPFYAELSKGIENKAFDMGYSVIFCSSDEKPLRTETCVKHMLRMGVDGLIFASVHLKEPVVEKLIADGFPTVLVNRKLKGASYHHVVCDNFQGAYDITRYLLDLGYRKIAMISGHTYLSTGLDRLKGYQKALKDRGIALSRDYVVEGPFAPETGYNAAKKLLALEDRPEAIFAGNDYIARGVMEAVEEMGLSIPEDVALTGFDNTSFAAMGRNKLTTVSQCRYEMGELAVQILVDTIECKNLDHTHNILLKAEIIVRESCGHKLRKK